VMLLWNCGHYRRGRSARSWSAVTLLRCWLFQEGQGLKGLQQH
jgi:hypothetical protein